MFIKSFLALLFLICVSAVKSFSQDYFVEIPFPDSTTITDLAVNQQGDIFVSANKWSGNVLKAIYKSSDEGLTWSIAYDFDDITARAVKINSQGTIYALGEYDLIEPTLIKSIDNGQTWTTSYVPVDLSTINDKLFFNGNDTLFISQIGPQCIFLLRSIDAGSSWDTIFATYGHSTETISSLATKGNTLYVGLTGFFEETGGVFRSYDNGLTWDYVGLFSNMVSDLSFNSNGDLFITSEGGNGNGGLYAIYAGTDTIERVLPSPALTSIVINSGDDIFAGYFYLCRVYHSSDNGNTYESIISGLPSFGSVNDLFIDSEHFLYAITSNSREIYRSIESTITSIKPTKAYKLLVFPNPCYDQITGFIPDAQNGEHVYMVYDQSGSLLIEGSVEINDYRFTLDLFYLPKGIYYLQIYSSRTYAVQIVKL